MGLHLGRVKIEGLNEIGNCDFQVGGIMGTCGSGLSRYHVILFSGSRVVMFSRSHVLTLSRLDTKQDNSVAYNPTTALADNSLAYKPTTALADNSLAYNPTTALADNSVAYNPITTAGIQQL
jgi:hypothetical protein